MGPNQTQQHQMALLGLVLLLSLDFVAAEKGLNGGTCNGNTKCPAQTSCQHYDDSKDDRRCLHKPLFPMSGQDWAAVFLVILASSLSAGGGIGGGGLLVPVYVLVLNFETNMATALSLATISGGSLANLWTYVQRYHPSLVVRRPLIDYDASLLFGPPLLGGTIVGSVFSVIFPEWLVVVCLVLLLGFSAFKTLNKGVQKWQQQQAWHDLDDDGEEDELDPSSGITTTTTTTLDPASSSSSSGSGGKAGKAVELTIRGGDRRDHESQALEQMSPSKAAAGAGSRCEGGGEHQDPSSSMAQAKVQEAAVGAEVAKLYLGNAGGKQRWVQRSSGGGGDGSGAVQLLMNDMNVTPQLRSIYREDSTLVPWWKFGATFVVWVVVLLFALLRGGRGGASVVGASCGGELYWGLFFLNLALLFGVTVSLREIIIARYELKKSLGHVDEEGDLHWTRNSSLLYPAIAIFAGIAAGLLGIGGGMVLGPLLVTLGCDPLTTAATSAFAVLITATSGLFQVAILGLLPVDYAWFFAVIGVLSTFAGQTVVDFLIRKYKKDAIVILIIGVTMVVALILMSVAGVIKLVEGAPVGFASLC